MENPKKSQEEKIMSINYQLVGKRIKECRNEQHIKQDALAWNAEISASYLSCVESGKNKVSLGAIARIAEALNVSLEFLLFGDKVYVDNPYRKLHAVFHDCSEMEQKIIMDAVLGIAIAIKRSLRLNMVL